MRCLENVRRITKTAMVNKRFARQVRIVSADAIWQSRPNTIIIRGNCDVKSQRISEGALNIYEDQWKKTPYMKRNSERVDMVDGDQSLPYETGQS